jgi:8-oxo-dGTP diphosphatase
MEPSPADAVDDTFVPNDEVDEIRWYPVADATARLTYAHDRTLLARAPVPT